MTNFTSGKQFFDFFKSYYSDGKVDKYDLLDLTGHYISTIFSSPMSYESEFLKLGFSEWLKLQGDNEHLKIMFAWESLIKQDCRLIVHDDLRTYMLLKVIEEATPENTKEKDSLFYKKVAQLLCDLMWERNKSVQDEELFKKSIWRISSDHIFSHEACGLAQRALLEAFWSKVFQIDSKREEEKDLFNCGMRLDSLVNVIFSEADPITLGQLYEVFHEILRFSYIRSLEGDGSKQLFDILNRTPLFGYLPRSTGVWSVQEEDEEDKRKANSFFERQRLLQRHESIKLVIKSSPLFLDSPRASAYCANLLKILNSSSFSDRIEKDGSKIDHERVVKLEKLIAEFKTCVENND
ncbi:hypothetical protein AUQ39_02560 [Lacticaseibacillus casei]|uniref:Uncharacterized protein n=1 Tax=Lacticaseibacillus zeae TaxID=57037 RepID=A0A5R8LXG0_LACZE|nr:hypothetical protein AUQ39_02560 [Lacticaseibacillus casei]TLF41984.1 hypothetical protein FEI14_06675 [Lacticaseibacillus zeae]